MDNESRSGKKTQALINVLLERIIRVDKTHEKMRKGRNEE